MPRVRLVTFDLDDTLWNGAKVIAGAQQRLQAWLEEAAPAAARLHRDPAQVTPIYQELLAGQPHLAHDLSALRKEVLRRLLRQAGHGQAAVDRLATRGFAVFLEARHEVEFFAGALEVLDALSHRHTLGALTNGNADPKRLGLDPYFSFSFSAADVGAMKPAPDLFRRALDHCGANPSEAVHVGDHPINDIAAAAGLGMRTVWLNGPHQRARPEDGVAEVATVEVEHLSQVPAAIARIELL